MRLATPGYAPVLYEQPARGIMPVMPAVCWGDLIAGLVVGLVVGWLLHMAATGEKPDTTPPR